MIPRRYKEMQGKELKAVMKSEAGSGNFGIALQFLAVSPEVAECDMIMKACSGVGTNELMLYPIICGRSNKEMQILKKTFFQIHSKDLGQTLDAELGGSFEKVIFNCLQASEEEYDEDYHSESKMKEDIATLFKMGTGSWGTDEVGLVKILSASPPAYLKKLNLAYAEKHGYTLLKVLEKELGGDTKDAAVFMLGMKLKPYETVAKLIMKACKGFGTNELLLTSAIIRYHHILKDVMEAFVEENGKTLQDTVKAETRGDYEDLLVQLCDSACM
jgi:annexin A7/11